MTNTDISISATAALFMKHRLASPSRLLPDLIIIRHTAYESLRCDPAGQLHRQE